MLKARVIALARVRFTSIPDFNTKREWKST